MRGREQGGTLSCLVIEARGKKIRTGGGYIVARLGVIAERNKGA
jgi:hypothetical protein